LFLAIGYMRNGSKDKPLSMSNPLQWDQYVMAHAYHCTEVGSGPEQVHWSWFFLPWHRAYLFFVERTLANFLTMLGRDGSKFALPYWDWISHKGLPNTSERIKLGKPSPLFGYDVSLENMVNSDGLKVGNQEFDNQALWDGNRGPTIDRPNMDPKSELTFDSKEHVEETILFMSPAYIHDFLLELPFEMFAGLSTISSATGMGALEHYPHNNGHDWVGSRFGKNRDMGSLRYAALDPIFFMHHANIDRIWSWYRKPQPDPDTSPWGKQQYTFVDIDGSPTTVTVRDIVKQMTNVTYVPPMSSTNAIKSFLAATQAVPEAAPKETREVLISKPSTLSAQPLTITTEPKPGIKALLSVSVEEKIHPLYVMEIETGSISYQGKFLIKLFVNKEDANSKTSINDPHYIGRIRALDSGGRRNEAEQVFPHKFFVILGKDDSNFYKNVRSNETFKLTLVPSGSDGLADFKIEVKSVTLTVVK
jgi:polyphenol oxidase